MDQLLLDKLHEAIEKNLQNEQFGVTELAKESGLSQSQLNRRLNALTGQTTNQFIREYRLRKAFELLQDNTATAAEVAYQVGFSSPSYFNSCFHNFFGYTPGEVKFRKPPYGVIKRPISNKVIVLTLVFAILLLLIYSISDYFKLTTPTPKNKITKSIAVIPFKYLSSNKDKRYWADAFTETITTHLFKIDEFQVVPYKSVEKFRNLSNKTERELGDELNVTYLVDGSLQLEKENTIQLVIKLIHAKEERVLFSKAYDREVADIIHVQSEIAKMIANALQIVISPEEMERIEKIPTKETAAYELYLEANNQLNIFWETHNTITLELVHSLLDKALQRDTCFAEAMVTKGFAFMAGGNCDSAIIYADRALFLDAGLNTGYQLKGECYNRLGHYDLAIENLSKAMDMPYSNGDPHWWSVQIGNAYKNKGELVKSLSYFEKSLELASNEFLPGVYANLGLIYLHVGYKEKAEKYMKKSIVNKDIFCPHVGWYAWSLNVQGKNRKAFLFLDSICAQVECEAMCNELLFQQSLELNDLEQAKHYYNQLENIPRTEGIPLYFHRNRVYQFHRTLGNTIEADRIHEMQMEDLNAFIASGSRFHNLLLSELYAYQGDKVNALKYLNEYAKGDFEYGWQDFIVIDPFFEYLWDDPEFKSVVKKSQEKKAAIRAQIKEMEKIGELNL